MATFENFAKSLDVLYIYHLLKKTTTEETAKSVSEVEKGMFDLLKNDDEVIPSNRTCYRFFEDIVTHIPSATSKDSNIDFTNSTEKKGISGSSSDAENTKLSPEELDSFLTSLFGGTIKTTTAKGFRTGKNKSNSASQYRYYFDPILSSSDLNTIVGLIDSSTYLSQAEKEYLNSRITLLYPNVESEITPIDKVHNLPKKPHINKKTSNLPVDISVLLENISVINNAIKKNCQIKLVYGEYGENIMLRGKVDFGPKHKNQSPLILNPYAMFWSRGQYYLIATRIGEKSINHYRVDRIFSVELFEKINIDGSVSFTKRDKIPDTLKPFFYKSQKISEFDHLKYTATYPHMYFWGNDKIVDCIFECTNLTVSLLIDAFGTDIKIEYNKDKSGKTLDAHGNPILYYYATVRNVQYDNAVGFASEYHKQVTLIRAFDSKNPAAAPIDIAEDIRKNLEESLKKYREIPKPV